MRESMAGSWEFQIIIIFVLMFVAYLTVSVSYYKTFKCKNDVITIIEKKEGMTDGATGAIGIINNYLNNNAYSSKGKCSAGSYGARSLSAVDKGGLVYIEEGDTTKYYYCVKKVTGYFEDNPDRSYYEVNLFFSLNLPIIGDIMDFGANGTTMEMDVTYDNL